jgi:hypothetical protein
MVIAASVVVLGNPAASYPSDPVPQKVGGTLSLNPTSRSHDGLVCDTAIRC